MDLATGATRLVASGLERDNQEGFATHGVFPGYAWMPDGKSLVATADGKIVRFDAATGARTAIPFTAKVEQRVTKALRFPQKLGADTLRARILRWPVESPNGKYNVPPVLHFTEGGPAIQNPGQPLTAAIAKTATAGVPMPLDLFVEDDALYASGTNAPMTRTPPVVEATLAKYRGPGAVKVEGFHPFTTIKGGKPMEPYAGKSNGTITFSAPGDYVVHVTINDFSEKGGGATGCCWTTAMVKVNVKPAAVARTTGQQ